MKKIKCIIFGGLAGIVNGLLGAGGGMLIVPMLKTAVEQKKAHATCVAIILPICLVSSIQYLASGKVTIAEAAPYMIFGIPGALIGSWLLPKINKKVLQKAFALLILWAAVKLLLKG